MYLSVGFSSLLWIKTISKIFVKDFSDLLIKFWEISKKCSNFVNFRARKMFFFLKQVRISPEKDWCSHQYPYGGILPHVAAVFVNFYVSTDMIAWWVSVHWHLIIDNKISCEKHDCDLFVQDALCIHKICTGENE